MRGGFVMWCVGPALPFAGAAVAQAWIAGIENQPDTRRFLGSFDPITP